MKEKIQQLVKHQLPEITDDFVSDFFDRMDDDYFEVFSIEDISDHIAMSFKLNRDTPIICKITSVDAGTSSFNIIITSFDHTGLFSIFCGLMSAYGLEIQSAHIYTFARAAKPKFRSRVVDYFKVQCANSTIFSSIEQSKFAEELLRLTLSIDNDARDTLNRMLSKRIEKMSIDSLLSPVDVEIDNSFSPNWTKMSIKAMDSFAFLYAFTNALSLRDIDIHKVEVTGSESQVFDVFLISDKWGRKIEAPDKLERLKNSVIMLKRFTRFLPEVSGPAGAMRRFDQFVDKIAETDIPNDIIDYITNPEGLSRIARLLGSGDYLWDEMLRPYFKDFLPLLKTHSTTDLTPLLSNTAFEELNRYKDKYLFLIYLRQLFDSNFSLCDFSNTLTRLAEVVLDIAIKISYEQLVERYGTPTLANAQPCEFTVCGLGKFGGGELGYASDLEILCVYSDAGMTTGPEAIENGLFYEYLTNKIIETIEARDKGIFHIDLRLRPHGKKGPLASPLSQLVNYYSTTGEAAQFERQSLIKLRYVTGDETLGHQVEAIRDKFTYSDTKFDMVAALALRERQVRELVKPGQVNTKYSRGGIVDIEYIAQYLQIIHGGKYPELRSPNTFEALAKLQTKEIIDTKTYDELRESLIFMHNLIDQLRIENGNSTDIYLPEASSKDFISLARRMGYNDPQPLTNDIAKFMERNKIYYSNFQYSPLRKG